MQMFLKKNTHTFIHTKIVMYTRKDKSPSASGYHKIVSTYIKDVDVPSAVPERTQVGASY